jgi:hypothetical protein
MGSLRSRSGAAFGGAQGLASLAAQGLGSLAAQGLASLAAQGLASLAAQGLGASRHRGAWAAFGGAQGLASLAHIFSQRNELSAENVADDRFVDGEDDAQLSKLPGLANGP